MNLGLTLIVQMLVFLTLVWFTMKFVWPIILGMMEQRSKTIAAGLAAAEKGQSELANAEKRAEQIIREARERAKQIEEQAARRANEAIEAAKSAASTEGARIVAAARGEIATESNRAREQLRKEIGGLVAVGASRVLEREVDAKAHAGLVDQLASQIASA